MKNLYIVIVSLIYCLNSIAQSSYHKMLGDTNKWYVSGFVLGVKSNSQQQVTNIGSPCIGFYKADKDSVYNSFNYKVFEYDGWICAFGFGTTPFSKALVREDTLTKKIYIVHPDSVNESVVMDFSMNVGDSMYLPYSTSSYVLKNGYYKLDSIIAKPHIMGSRNHFYLSKYDAPLNFLNNKKYYVEWIESIGAVHFPINVINEDATNDFFMPFTCTSNQFASYVTCKYTNGVKYYQDSCALNYAQTNQYYVFSGDNCQYYGFTGHVKELSFLHQTELYPNPTSTDGITLKFKALYYKPIEISIYNTMGQKLYTKTLTIETTDNEIILQHLKLSQGLYSIVLKSANESASINFIKN